MSGDCLAIISLSAIITAVGLGCYSFGWWLRGRVQ
jgi:hypothetical protein